MKGKNVSKKQVVDFLKQYALESLWLVKNNPSQHCTEKFFEWSFFLC
jgi:hypothetical protein